MTTQDHRDRAPGEADAHASAAEEAERSGQGKVSVPSVDPEPVPPTGSGSPNLPEEYDLIAPLIEIEDWREEFFMKLADARLVLSTPAECVAAWATPKLLEHLRRLVLDLGTFEHDVTQHLPQ